MRKHPAFKFLAWGLLFGLVSPSLAKADELYGKIRGTVTDQSGAVVPGTEITATNPSTGLSKAATAGPDGAYEFLQLPAPGDYNVTAKQSGFKLFTAAKIHLFLNQIYVLNVKLEVGAITQEITVEAAPAQIERTSMQLGSVITSSQVVDLPLNGRNWIQLQQTLPGVMASSDRFGSNFSTNGARTQANGYMINGTDANDLPLNTALFIPSPDAIAEVHIVTNTINPEYGRNSGAILNAVTKSGTNAFHGSGFEFYRDNALNSRNFFQKTPIVFHQNQFGATVGGPIKKNKAFFFFSYQGTRNRAAQSQLDATFSTARGTTTVFTQNQRNGIFPDIAGSSAASPFPLVGENGKTFPAGTPYSTIFPTGHIPTTDFNPISANLLNKFVPLPNSGATEFSFNPFTINKADQYITRIDLPISSKDSLWGYWFIQPNTAVDTLPFVGANVPGFPEQSTSRRQHYTLAWNHTFGGSMLNEARFGYNRFNFVAVQPVTPVLPSSLGFSGIIPQNAQAAGVPTIVIGNVLALGFSDDGPQPRIDQTYQATDNFSWIKGRHSLKFGFEMRRAQVSNPFSFENNGHFDFVGSGDSSTGNGFADFLLGIPDDYAQSSGGFIDARTQEYYSYAQDVFRLRPNLTLTYGVSWQVDTPLTDIFNKSVAINCFRPGQQSKVFPTAPVGLVFPGDSSCTPSGYETRFGHFGPRVGFAWSPGSSQGWSIRGGYGIYFNVPEEELTLQNLLAPPFALIDFGITDVGGSPSFATPFTDISGTFSIPNKYPYFPPKAGSSVDFGFFEPFALNVIDPNFTTPYSMNYNLTVERQLPFNTIFSVAYVGLQGRHLENTQELNPAGRPPGVNPTCAANPRCNAFNMGFRAPGAFKFDPTVFGSVGQQSTDSLSNYNSLQVTVTKHMSHGLEFRSAYTYSHSIDDSSSFEQSGLANPFNRRGSDRGDSRFDARHRWVLTTIYDIPSARRFNAFQRIPSRLTDGWRITGIVTLQGGFPIPFSDSSFRSLLCNVIFSFYGCPERPNQLGPVRLTDPRAEKFVNTVKNPINRTIQDHYFFFPNSFARQTRGVLGNLGRDAFHGPGINNFDFALFKDTKITESTRIELRFEFFNIINHTQFNNPSGNVNSVNFGRVLTSRDPRIVQLAAKVYF